MKIRILSIACVTTAAALLAACTAVYKNSDACEQLMRSKLAETSPDTLKIAHTGVGIDGSRVVVEGSIEHVVTASEVAGASAASAAASAARIANAPRPASGARAVSGVSAASSVPGVVAVSDGTVGGASASLAASGSATASVKSAKPQKTTTAAAAECTFHGSALNVFNWLAPASLVKPADQAASAAAK